MQAVRFLAVVVLLAAFALGCSRSAPAPSPRALAAASVPESPESALADLLAAEPSGLPSGVLLHSAGLPSHEPSIVSPPGISPPGISLTSSITIANPVTSDDSMLQVPASSWSSMQSTELPIVGTAGFGNLAR